MTQQCRFAGDCANDGRNLVRIHGTGDRLVCDQHLAWMTEHGMDFRILPTNLPVPAWRQRDLGRSMDHSTRIVA